VSFHTADETQWSAATLNYPVTSGNSFWTEPNAGADIDVGATRLVMASQTELDITTLDDHTTAATEAQGELFLHIRNLAQGENFTITTPRAVVTLAAAGHYDIVAGDTEHPTLINVIDGSAQINGTNISLQLTSKQAATVTGTQTFQATVGAENDDAFIRAQLDREKPPAPRVTTPSPQDAPPVASVAPPAIVAEMTGGDELADTGQWAPTPDYGAVWYPPVEAGWVPYRHGHWAYVAPWGWTWVDAAPWGFAPSHYGRWVEINDRWAWTPGVLAEGGGPYRERPVYAPAIVSFVGLAAGAALGAAAGLALGRSVGWIPLGPREPYIPPYRTSNEYLTRVNVTNVTNITNITNIRNNPPPVSQFVNQRAATVVPGSAMVSSQQIAPHVQPVPANFGAEHPIERAPIAPTAATIGVTPAVARQLNIPAAEPGATSARAVSPGPAVQPRPTDFGHGPLRPAGTEPTPGAPGSGAPPGTTPNTEAARPGISPRAAALGGAALGGAAVGGAALLNRQQPANTPRTPGSPVAPATGASAPGAPAVPAPGARPPGLPPLNGGRTPGALAPAPAPLANRPTGPSQPGPAPQRPQGQIAPVAPIAPRPVAPTAPAVPNVVPPRPNPSAVAPVRPVPSVAAPPVAPLPRVETPRPPVAQSIPRPETAIPPARPVTPPRPAEPPRPAPPPRLAPQAHPAPAHPNGQRTPE
jgi:hypothetical protein